VARPLRQELAGGIFHVYARGNRKQRIFFDDRDRRTYMTLLSRTVRRRRWHCLGYCLMTTHVHLILETPEPNLGVGMQHFHGPFAQLLNKRHGLTGHAFEGRFHSPLITSDEQLWMTARYLALNPVEAGLVKIAEMYKWSSHAAIVTGRPPAFLAVDRLLAHFGDEDDGFARYRRFVDSTIPKGV
jgi:REP element-mobilizing transposase RayT